MSRRYHQGGRVVTAVDSLNLTVAAGEMLAVTGSSGSGKTTLLNLLGGLDTPTSGSIEVLGRALAGLSDRELASYRRQDVGIIFQAFRLLADRTALENVELPLTIAEVSRLQRRQRAEAALTAVGLAERMHHRPAELSGGEQQRVGVARALVKGARLVLADEPTGNLDSATSRELMQLLARLRTESELTVVVVSHDLALVEEFTTRVVTLQDGRVAV